MKIQKKSQFLYFVNLFFFTQEALNENKKPSFEMESDKMSPSGCNTVKHKFVFHFFFFY